MLLVVEPLNRLVCFADFGKARPVREGSAHASRILPVEHRFTIAASTGTKPPVRIKAGPAARVWSSPSPELATRATSATSATRAT